jgi:hypothetical protein
MYVALVSRIPDYLICGTIEYTVKRNSEFHDTEIGSEMTAISGNGINKNIPDFRAQFTQLCS